MMNNQHKKNTARKSMPGSVNPSFIEGHHSTVVLHGDEQGTENLKYNQDFYYNNTGANQFNMMNGEFKGPSFGHNPRFPNKKPLLGDRPVNMAPVFGRSISVDGISSNHRQNPKFHEKGPFEGSRPYSENRFRCESPDDLPKLFKSPRKRAFENRHNFHNKKPRVQTSGFGRGVKRQHSYGSATSGSDTGDDVLDSLFAPEGIDRFDRRSRPPDKTDHRPRDFKRGRWEEEGYERGKQSDSRNKEMDFRKGDPRKKGRSSHGDSRHYKDRLETVRKDYRSSRSPSSESCDSSKSDKHNSKRDKKSEETPRVSKTHSRDREPIRRDRLGSENKKTDFKQRRSSQGSEKSKRLDREKLENSKRMDIHNNRKKDGDSENVNSGGNEKQRRKSTCDNSKNKVSNSDNLSKKNQSLKKTVSVDSEKELSSMESRNSDKCDKVSAVPVKESDVCSNNNEKVVEKHVLTENTCLKTSKENQVNKSSLPKPDLSRSNSTEEQISKSGLTENDCSKKEQQKSRNLFDLNFLKDKLASPELQSLKNGIRRPSTEEKSSTGSGSPISENGSVRTNLFNVSMETKDKYSPDYSVSSDILSMAIAASLSDEKKSSDEFSEITDENSNSSSVQSKSSSDSANSDSKILTKSSENGSKCSKRSHRSSGSKSETEKSGSQGKHLGSKSSKIGKTEKTATCGPVETETVSSGESRCTTDIQVSSVVLDSEVKKSNSSKCIKSKSKESEAESTTSSNTSKTSNLSKESEVELTKSSSTSNLSKESEAESTKSSKSTLKSSSKSVFNEKCASAGISENRPNSSTGKSKCENKLSKSSYLSKTSSVSLNGTKHHSTTSTSKSECDSLKPTSLSKSHSVNPSVLSNCESSSSSKLLGTEKGHPKCDLSDSSSVSKSVSPDLSSVSKCEKRQNTSPKTSECDPPVLLNKEKCDKVAASLAKKVSSESSSEIERVKTSGEKLQEAPLSEKNISASESNSEMADINKEKSADSKSKKLKQHHDKSSKMLVVEGDNSKSSKSPEVKSSKVKKEQQKIKTHSVSSKSSKSSSLKSLKTSQKSSHIVSSSSSKSKNSLENKSKSDKSASSQSSELTSLDKPIKDSNCSSEKELKFSNSPEKSTKSSMKIKDKESRRKRHSSAGVSHHNKHKNETSSDARKRHRSEKCLGSVLENDVLTSPNSQTTRRPLKLPLSLCISNSVSDGLHSLDSVSEPCDSVKDLQDSVSQPCDSLSKSHDSVSDIGDAAIATKELSLTHKKDQQITVHCELSADGIVTSEINSDVRSNDNEISIDSFKDTSQGSRTLYQPGTSDISSEEDEISESENTDTTCNKDQHAAVSVQNDRLSEKLGQINPATNSEPLADTDESTNGCEADEDGKCQSGGSTPLQDERSDSELSECLYPNKKGGDLRLKVLIKKEPLDVDYGTSKHLKMKIKEEPMDTGYERNPFIKVEKVDQCDKSQSKCSNSSEMCDQYHNSQAGDSISSGTDPNRKEQVDAVCYRKEPEDVVCNRKEPEEVVCNRKEPEDVVCNRKEPEDVVCNRNELEDDECNNTEPEDVVCNRKEPEDVVNNRKEPEDLVCNRKESEDVVCNRNKLEDVSNRKKPEDVVCNRKEPEDIVCNRKEPEDVVSYRKELEDDVCNRKEPEDVLFNNEDNEMENNLEVDDCCNQEAELDAVEAGKDTNTCSVELATLRKEVQVRGINDAAGSDKNNDMVDQDSSGDKLVIDFDRPASRDGHNSIEHNTAGESGQDIAVSHQSTCSNRPETPSSAELESIQACYSINSASERPETAASTSHIPNLLHSISFRPVTPHSTSSRPETPECTSSRPETPECTRSRPETPRSRPETPRCMSSKPDTPGFSSSRPETPSSTRSRPETPECTSTRPETPGFTSSRQETPGCISSRSETPGSTSPRPETPTFMNMNMILGSDEVKSMKSEIVVSEISMTPCGGNFQIVEKESSMVDTSSQDVGEPSTVNEHGSKTCDSGAVNSEDINTMTLDDDENIGDRCQIKENPTACDSLDVVDGDLEKSVVESESVTGSVSLDETIAYCQSSENDETLNELEALGNVSLRNNRNETLNSNNSFEKRLYDPDREKRQTTDGGINEAVTSNHEGDSFNSMEDFDDDEDVKIMVYVKGVPQSPWAHKHEFDDTEDLEMNELNSDVQGNCLPEQDIDIERCLATSEGSYIPSSQPGSPTEMDTDLKSLNSVNNGAENLAISSGTRISENVEQTEDDTATENECSNNSVEPFFAPTLNGQSSDIESKIQNMEMMLKSLSDSLAGSDSPLDQTRLSSLSSMSQNFEGLKSKVGVSSVDSEFERLTTNDPGTNINSTVIPDRNSVKNACVSFASGNVEELHIEPGSQGCSTSNLHQSTGSTGLQSPDISSSESSRNSKLPGLADQTQEPLLKNRKMSVIDQSSTSAGRASYPDPIIAAALIGNPALRQGNRQAGSAQPNSADARNDYHQAALQLNALSAHPPHNARTSAPPPYNARSSTYSNQTIAPHATTACQSGHTTSNLSAQNTGYAGNWTVNNGSSIGSTNSSAVATAASTAVRGNGRDTGTSDMYPLPADMSIRFTHIKTVTVLDCKKTFNTFGSLLPVMFGDELHRCVQCYSCKNFFSPMQFKMHMDGNLSNKISYESLNAEFIPTENLNAQEIRQWDKFVDIYNSEIVKHKMGINSNQRPRHSPRNASGRHHSNNYAMGNTPGTMQGNNPCTMQSGHNMRHQQHPQPVGNQQPVDQANQYSIYHFHQNPANRSATQNAQTNPRTQGHVLPSPSDNRNPCFNPNMQPSECQNAYTSQGGQSNLSSGAQNFSSNMAPNRRHSMTGSQHIPSAGQNISSTAQNVSTNPSRRTSIGSSYQTTSGIHCSPQQALNIQTNHQLPSPSSSRQHLPQPVAAESTHSRPKTIMAATSSTSDNLSRSRNPSEQQAVVSPNHSQASSNQEQQLSPGSSFSNSSIFRRCPSGGIQLNVQSPQEVMKAFRLAQNIQMECLSSMAMLVEQQDDKIKKLEKELQMSNVKYNEAAENLDRFKKQMRDMFNQIHSSDKDT